MYTRVKAKCLACALHFVVCTLRPDRHTAASLYCPECGQHDGDFLVWRQPTEGFISQEVPGGAAPDASPAVVRPRRPWWRFWSR